MKIGDPFHEKKIFCYIYYLTLCNENESLFYRVRLHLQLIQKNHLFYLYRHFVIGCHFSILYDLGKIKNKNRHHQPHEYTPDFWIGTWRPLTFKVLEKYFQRQKVTILHSVCGQEGGSIIVNKPLFVLIKQQNSIYKIYFTFGRGRKKLFPLNGCLKSFMVSGFNRLQSYVADLFAHNTYVTFTEKIELYFFILI